MRDRLRWALVLLFLLSSGCIHIDLFSGNDELQESTLSGKGADKVSTH